MSTAWITAYQGGSKSFDLAIPKPTGATATLLTATLKISPKFGGPAIITRPMIILDPDLWTATYTVTDTETNSIPGQNQYAIFVTFSAPMPNDVVDEGTFNVIRTPR